MHLWPFDAASAELIGTRNCEYLGSKNNEIDLLFIIGLARIQRRHSL